MSDTILLDVRDGVAVVSLNRPERHNAFNDEMDARFFEVLAGLAEDRDVRCVLWRGEGKSFSSGRDTAELGHRAKGESDMEFIAAGHAKTALLWSLPVPVVAALKGWSLGGSFERALLCDIRVCSADVRMGLPEVQHGVIPDSGGTARLFQMAGHGVAAELALTGRIIGADEALRHGIVSRVCEPDALDEEAFELARTIASRPPLAVRLALQTVRSLATPAIERSMHEELLAQTVIFGSADWAEMKAARAEGRDPVFRTR